jgi:DNA-binding response OmpR family regulator
LVEDHIEVARALQRTFAARGFAASIAVSAAEALVEVTQWDCAVLDIDLPDGTGIALAAEIRNRRLAACLVFYSAQTDPDVMAAAEQYGPFVAKGAGADELIEVVQWQIQRAGRAASSGTFETSTSGRAKRRAKA